MTLISIGGVATGVWALTVVLSVMSGFEQDLKSKILGAHAHGVVLKYGQNDFVDWRGTQERVLSVPGVAASTPFLYAEVMLSAGQNLTGSILKGVDTATLGKVTEIPAAWRRGSWSGWTGLGRSRRRGRAWACPRPWRATEGARPRGRKGRPRRNPPRRSSPGSCWAASWRAGCASGSATWSASSLRSATSAPPARSPAAVPPGGRPPLQRILRVRRQVRVSAAGRGPALLRHRRLGDRARAQGGRRERGPAR